MQFSFAIELRHLLVYGFRYHFHLLREADIPLAIIGGNGFVEQHWSELGVHYLLLDHPINRGTDIPVVHRLVVYQSLEASRCLVESSPDTGTKSASLVHISLS